MVFKNSKEEKKKKINTKLALEAKKNKKKNLNVVRVYINNIEQNIRIINKTYSYLPSDSFEKKILAENLKLVLNKTSYIFRRWEEISARGKTRKLLKLPISTVEETLNLKAEVENTFTEIIETITETSSFSWYKDEILAKKNETQE